MRDSGASGFSTKKPVNNFNSHCNDEYHFRGDPRGDPRGHRAPYDDWMTGGGRGRRRAMMAMMMRDQSGMAYGMHHGRFGFGDRGGRGHGWFGFGGRGRGFGGRGRGGHRRNCRSCMVDDDDDYVTSMAEMMNECRLNEGSKGVGSGSSESSSSSSSSESDDEQHAPDDDVQGRYPHGGEVPDKEGTSIDQTQREITKSDAAEGEKDQPSSDQCCNHGYHGRRHGRGHHKHHHGKHMHNNHHHHHAPHHYMLPPYIHGFNRRHPFPLMYQASPYFHGNRRHMAKKFFKRSMKKWYKGEKRAWKHQQGDNRCHGVQRSDGDETVTSGCDNDDDIANPEIQCQLPLPWFFFSHDHHGCGYGRRGFCHQGKKGKKHGERRRQCNCERPRPAEDTNTQTATSNQADAVNEADADQPTMEDIAQ